MELKFNEGDIVRKHNNSQEMIVVKHLTNMAHVLMAHLKGNKKPELEKVAAVLCKWEVDGVGYSKNIEESELVLVKHADGSK